ncbi:MAG: hypothetical protein V3U46_02070, partial [Acidimicrobiia bacterium]
SVGRIDDADDHNTRSLEDMAVLGSQEGTASTVDLGGVIQFHRGEIERALVLLGGAESVWGMIGTDRWPEATYAVEAVLTAAREKLGDSEFERLLAEGRALSLEALTELAFSP